MKRTLDSILIVVSISAVVFAFAILWIDAQLEFPIAKLTAGFLAVGSAAAALFQFFREGKISEELDKLEEAEENQELTGLKGEALVRQRQARRLALKRQRLAVVFGIVVLIALSEILSMVDLRS